MIDNCLVETFAAGLTAAVYLVALRHGPGESWIELELALWKAVADTVDEWQPAFSGPQPSAILKGAMRCPSRGAFRPSD
jgi:hypothetical protein